MSLDFEAIPYSGYIYIQVLVRKEPRDEFRHEIDCRTAEGRSGVKSEQEDRLQVNE